MSSAPGMHIRTRRGRCKYTRFEKVLILHRGSCKLYKVQKVPIPQRGRCKRYARRESADPTARKCKYTRVVEWCRKAARHRTGTQFLMQARPPISEGNRTSWCRKAPRHRTGTALQLQQSAKSCIENRCQTAEATSRKRSDPLHPDFIGTMRQGFRCTLNLPTRPSTRHPCGDALWSR